jgi:hypothetical protein
MKKLLFIISIMLCISAIGYSQAPGFFNYQGVARNSVGTVLKNQNISLRLTIHDGAAAGPVVYQETRGVTTNALGLFNVQIGSPGASGVSGSIPATNWAVNSKFIQVEVDPAGGSSFLNLGTAQLASVPYSLFATTASDMVLPFIKTQAASGTTLIGLTNSSLTGTSGAFTGTSASNDGNASAITGTISSPTPGGFSAGLRGVNNGTGGLGIGVWGSQNGSGWGVHGTAPSGIGGNFSTTSGIGVNAAATTGDGLRATTNGAFGKFGVFGIATADATGVAGNSGSGIAVLGVSGTGPSGVFQNFTAANATSTLQGFNQSGSGAAVEGTNSGTGRGGFFQVLNAASTADAIRAETNGTGASWAIRGISSGTNGAGLFQQTNATNTSNNLQSNQAGLGRAGLFNSTNAASTANAVDINVAGTGFALRAASTNAAPKALLTAGGLQLTGIGEAVNRVLVSDAAGNATWQPAGGAGIVTGTGTTQFIPRWTSPSNIGNSLLFDNGSSVGLGTITPTHRFDVTHGGSTGIGVNSTAGFSVVDINAASGDAALRFGNAGVNQWNTRNRPADNYYEIFELGGGGSRMVIQDATGNVGIGETANPSYKLDVLHGGSTGARIRSSASFSVVDIDAQSGDAALRFAKAGVNQWNIRNRPADDYLEIFELGGGGSRVVIQDATGNVGIGETTSPSYKLDVLHGGSTGIRSRSSGSFSVVDIDAASGDAALRFAKAGVNQWNTRNRPADDYYEIFELGGGGSRVVIQDGTGNVGIGETTAPSYKLDVLHGGSTGIRSRSSSSFSVVDIDAQSGDAALRFQKAGVNQWNVRNRPADDYFEIFELGGGGSRVVIQDATGNVGIGETTAPAYKLDVLHGGSTGIRSRSSASFSVVDIDGQSGDAALRFQKAGVNQWNTRNEPATDNYQIFELGGGGERLRIENTTGTVVVSGDFTVLGAKAFTMDHPLDPANKLLRHAAAESNEVINFYSGNITTDASGKATVSLPDYYEALNKDSRYQLTVIGSFAQAIISKEVSNNKFEIATSVPNIKVSWEVKGVRNDARMKMHPFVAEEVKTGAQKGKYWDAASHNQPASKGVSYDGNLESSLNDVKPVAKKAAPATTGGSLEQGAIVPPSTAKAAEKGGSIEDMPAKKGDAKAAPATKGGSLDDMPKPAEKKAVSTEEGSTKSE